MFWPLLPPFWPAGIPVAERDSASHGAMVVAGVPALGADAPNSLLNNFFIKFFWLPESPQGHPARPGLRAGKGWDFRRHRLPTLYCAG